MDPTHILNLLPPEDRLRVGRERLARFFTLFHGGIALVLIMGIILLLPTYFFLFFQNKGLAEFVAIKYQNIKSDEAQKTEALIQESNAQLRRLGKNSIDSPSITRHLRDIVSLAPSGITLTHFSYQKDTSAILLKGAADTRENLLRFISSLRGHAEFHEVESPVENILQEHNISFTLSFSLIPSKQPE